MKTPYHRYAGAIVSVAAAGWLAGCATAPGDAPRQAPQGRALGAQGPSACAALKGARVEAAAIGIPSGAAAVESAEWLAAAPVQVAPQGATPAGRITPAAPAFCKVQGRIAPRDPLAPPILFQVNLPAQWNGRSLQLGGGGFNGVLTSGQGLPPAWRFDQPGPLAAGFVTVGTDSGHQNKPSEAIQAFALNDEAFENFAHASYKKVRDVSVALMQRLYGKAPDRMYFMGSSEGGREAMTMAQRYPDAFDGIVARVPVLNWTGLLHASARSGQVLAGQGWISPALTKHYGEAVLAACDAADGLKDGIVADPVGCRQKFDPARLACGAAGAGAATCLNPAQLKAVQTLYAPYVFGFPLANGVTQYPGWGLSGEAVPAAGPTGGWGAWWSGGAEPKPDGTGGGIAYGFGFGTLRYVFARDPKADLASYTPDRHRARVEQVSALMDATNPDLSAFARRGGKLIMLEYLGDFAQSPYAGIGYYQSVVQRMGAARTGGFLRLYTAPSVDHVGSGAPGNADLMGALAAWVEQGRMPGMIELVEQGLQAPFTPSRTRPLCEWPSWPRYRGTGDVNNAVSFACVHE